MMSALISLVISFIMFLVFVFKLSFFIVVIGFQYGVWAYIIYKFFRFITRPLRYSQL